MENKNMQKQGADLKIANRAIRGGALLGAIVACISVNAADPNTPAKTDANNSYSTSATIESATRRDANFIKEAAKGGQMEVKLGQLAADHSQNAEVKRFGERLVKDHSAANEELTKIAQAKGVDLTKEADRAGTAAAKEVDKLSNKSGADFDKAYIKYMVSDHKKDIAKFEKEAAQSNDADVRAFAQKTLPTLREHLQMAEDIGRSLGVETASYVDKAVGSAPSTSSGGSSTDKK